MPTTPALCDRLAKEHGVALGKCVAEYETSVGGFAKVAVIMIASSADPNIGGRAILFILGLFFW